mgnify:CR=1 FL=1
MLANILDGIMNAISMGSLLANLMGVTLGIIFGALQDLPQHGGGPAYPP